MDLFVDIVAPTTVTKPLAKLPNFTLTEKKKIHGLFPWKRTIQHIIMGTKRVAEREGRLGSGGCVYVVNEMIEGSSSENESLQDISGDEIEYQDEFDGSAEESSEEEEESEEEDQDDKDTHIAKKSKSDSAAFAKAMTAILGSKIKAHDRKDPILVRSKKSAKDLEASRLEAKAKRALAAEKKSGLDKDRIKTLYSSEAHDLQGQLEYEKRLKKTAQRGVVKLFNAIQASQKSAAAESAPKNVVQEEKGKYF